ncbi:MAG: DJ-1/PfpI family protein, partial [Lachnospiraceae bacterium]|nr:DJ-1/PfpI family protein [Lachnospiraceae bacterium]
VCYPTFESHLTGATIPAKEVAHDGNIITSRGMGTAIAFAGEIVKTILDEETADELLKQLIYKQF